MNVSTSLYSTSDIPVVKAISFGLSMVILSIITLFGNGLVVLAFFKFKHLRTIPNYFIVSLATADILVPVLREGYAIVAALLRRWPFGNVWCHISATCSYILCASSISHLMCISIDRMVCIRRPFYYNSHATPAKALLVVVFVWIFAIITGLCPQFGFGDIEFNAHVMECEVNWQTSHRDRVLVSLLVSCFYVVPLIIMIVSYSLIFSVTRQQVHRLTVLESGVSSIRPIEREMKAARTISIIVGAFFVMWFPYFLVTLRRVIARQHVSPDLLRLALVLCYGNSCCNPIIYTLMNRQLRNAFQRILRRKQSRISPDFGNSVSERDTRYFGTHGRSLTMEPVEVRTTGHA